MENIIPIDELPDFIDRAIAKVNEGVALARRRGILAELPKEVQFDVTLVSNFQALEVVSTEISKGTETSKDEGKSESKDEGKSESKTGGSSSREGTESSSRNSESEDSSSSASGNSSYSYE